jgi:hypothetical protein
MSRTAESTESTDAPVDASTGAGPMAPLRLVDVVFGAMAAKVVYAAAELRVADLLAEGVQTSEELAERTGRTGRRCGDCCGRWPGWAS